jgi:hypothetical protein
VKLTCSNCGVAFEVPSWRRSQQFCGRSCRDAAQRRPLSTAECANCRKTFETKHSGRRGGKRQPKFCSTQCFADGTRKYPKFARCGYCGTTYTPRASERGSTRFCSVSCYGASHRKPSDACLNCGNAFRSVVPVAGNRTRYCSLVCYYAARRGGQHVPSTPTTVGLGGHQVRINEFPPELRRVAELVVETRRELRRRGVSHG